MSKVVRVGVTSKNRLTLPADLVEYLGVRAGDLLRFEIHDDGRITVEPPPFEERIRPAVGILKGRGTRPTREESDRAIREMRGPIDE